MKRPLQWEINEFIMDELGLPLTIKHELIEIPTEREFGFYMIAFFDEEHGDVSLACYWPTNKKAPSADEPMKLL